MIRNFMISAAASLILMGCTAGDKTDAAKAANDVAKKAVETTPLQNTAEAASEALTDKTDTARLAGIIDNQSAAAKARFAARHPQETPEFFGVKPGMTVIEVLPGGGWYTKIISPFLGADGHLVGVDYDFKMWPEFGGFADAKFIKERETWADGWTADMASAIGEDASQLSAYPLGKLPASLKGKADMVLLIRALHNMARFNEKGGYLDSALKELHASLKPGGIVGIVQHAGPEVNEDSWADGNNGYLKQSFVIAQMEKAGFEFVASSDVNKNPRDIPSNSDIVWRLPPSLGTSKDDAELRARMEAIGESNRMTLKFTKPE